MQWCCYVFYDAHRKRPHPKVRFSDNFLNYPEWSKCVTPTGSVQFLVTTRGQPHSRLIPSDRNNILKAASSVVFSGSGWKLHSHRCQRSTRTGCLLFVFTDDRVLYTLSTFVYGSHSFKQPPWSQLHLDLGWVLQLQNKSGLELNVKSSG